MHISLQMADLFIVRSARLQNLLLAYSNRDLFREKAKIVTKDLIRLALQDTLHPA